MRTSTQTIFFTVAALLFSAVFPFVSQGDERPIVWLVHGFRSSDTDLSPSINLLKEIYPQAETVKAWRWNAPKCSLIDIPVQWNDTMVEQKKAVENLFRDIKNLGSARQKRLILVGHSLGGSIVIKALAKCHKEKITIDHFVLAGAAIPNDDADIEKALETVENRSYSLVNMRDAALGVFRSVEHDAALGTGYAKKDTTGKLCEIAFSMGDTHDMERYIGKFKECVDSQNFKSEEILVPQDYLNWRMDVIDQKGYWKVLDSKNDWELQQHTTTGHCRILSPDKERMAWGRRAQMEESFEKVKSQLKESTQKTHKDIVVKQHYSNVEMDTTGGKDRWWKHFGSFWTNLDECRGWKLQQHSITSHCRILDPDDVRRAWGSEERMRESFDDVKRQIKEFGL